MMIRAFHFEQLQQQRGEFQQPTGQTPGQMGGDHSSLLTPAQLATIFSAFMASLFIAIFFYFLTLDSDVSFAISTLPLLYQAGQVFLVAIAFALGAVLWIGVPIAAISWQTTPRIRFLLALPFLSFVLPVLAIFFMIYGAIPMGILILGLDIALAVRTWRSTPSPRVSFRLFLPFLCITLLLIMGILQFLLTPILYQVPLISSLIDLLDFILSFPILGLGNLGNLILLMFMYGTPIVCTIAISRAIRQAAIPAHWLRKAQFPARIVTLALIVMFLALLSWGFYLAVLAPSLFFAFLMIPPFTSWIILCLGMLVSAIVAVRALSSRQ